LVNTRLGSVASAQRSENSLLARFTAVHFSAPTAQTTYKKMD
jgi:hypothetical protein